MRINQSGIPLSLDELREDVRITQQPINPHKGAEPCCLGAGPLSTSLLSQATCSQGSSDPGNRPRSSIMQPGGKAELRPMAPFWILDQVLAPCNKKAPPF